MASNLVALACTALLCPALGLGLEDSSSLVQGGLRVHNASISSLVNCSFLVDNSHLQHRGPGLLLRRSKSLSDVAGSTEYLSWGTVFRGRAAGEGWVQFKDYYLPTSVKGAQVLTLQQIFVEPAEKPKPHGKLRFHYAPTQMRLPSGEWAPCRIWRAGSKPNTYDVMVNPANFASYNVSNVPETSLQRVRHIREFDEVKAVASTTEPPAAESTIRLMVNDTKGNSLRLQMFSRSPLRSAMKMACDKVGIPEYRCLKKVRFYWKGTLLRPDNFTQDLNMTSGDTIIMSA